MCRYDHLLVSGGDFVGYIIIFMGIGLMKVPDDFGWDFYTGDWNALLLSSGQDATAGDHYYRQDFPGYNSLSSRYRAKARQSKLPHIILFY